MSELKFEIKTQDIDKCKEKVNDLKNSLDSIKSFIEDWAANNTISKHLKGINGEIKTLDEIFSETAIHIIPAMNKLQEYNEKIFEAEQKANTVRIKNVDAEIDGLNKTARTVENVIKSYDKKEEALKKQAKEIEKQYEKTAQKEIEAQKGNEAEILQIKTRLAARLEGVDNGLRQSIKNNNEERMKAVSALVSDSVKQYAYLYEKKRAMIIEDTEQQKQQMKLLYDKAIEEAKSDEKKLRLKEVLKRNLLAIDEDLNNKLTENAKKQMEETSAMVDKSMASITETIKENKKNGLGLIDYKKTKENLGEVKKQLNDYKVLLEQARVDSLKYYSALEKQYEGDAEKLKQIQDEKAKSMAMFAKENEKIEKAVTDTSKKENGLRMEQTKEAFAKTAEIAEKAVKEFEKNSKDIMNGFQEGLNFIGVEFETNAEKYKEQISQLDAKSAEITKNQEGYAQELSMLRYKQADTNQKMTQYEEDQLKKLEQAEKDNLKAKVDINKQKEELEKKKEKADKNRRKVELGKELISAIGSVSAGVAKALAGGIWGIAQGVYIAAQGAIAINNIRSEIAKFEDGGLLRGKRHSQGGMRIDGTNIEVEGGEYVVNRESTNKNLRLIGYINSQRKELKPQDINNFFSTPFPHFSRPEYKNMFESGGQVPSLPMSADVDAKILQAIERINFQPRVSVTDINTVQQQMTQADEWIGI